MSGVVIHNATGDGKVVTHVTQKQIETHLSLVRRLKASATMLYNSLKLGATVEDGAGKAFLAIGAEVKPNWRKAFLEKCGKDAIDAARAATASKPFCRLRVETAVKPATK